MGGRQSINLCVHILGPHEASAGWQPPPGRRMRARPGTRAAGGSPRCPWQRSPSSEHSATHLPPAPRLPVSARSAPRVPAASRGAGPGATAHRRPSAGRGPPSATPGRRSAARSAEQCAAAPPLTSHVAVQAARRGPDCPGHCGIATPGCPPREWELAGSGHGSMASAPTRRAAARDCGMSPCSLLSPRAGFRRCAAPPPRRPRQEGARTRQAPTRSPGPRPPARLLARSPRPAPPLTAAPAPRARRPAREARKVRRKVRVSGPACRGRSAAPPGTWRAKGGKEGARVLVGDFPPAVSTPQFRSSPGKQIVSQAQTQATFPSNQ